MLYHLITNRGQDIINSLKEGYFNGDERLLFREIKELYSNGEEINPVLLTSIDSFKIMEMVSSTGYFSTSSESEKSVNLLKEAYEKKSFKSKLGKALADLNDGLVEDAKYKLLESLREEAQEEEGVFFDSNLLSVMVHQELDNIRENKTLPDLKTGFKKIDGHVFFRPTDLVIIAGRPGMGKTAYSLSVTRNLLENGYSGKFYTLEMQPADLVKRMYSDMGQIPLGKLMTMEGLKNLTAQEQDRLDLLSNKFRSYDLEVIDVKGKYSKLDGLTASIKRSYRQKRFDFVVVDYIQLIQSDGKSEYENITEISKTLKNVAKELGIVVIALSQLNRANESQANRRPSMSHLRGSGQLEQDASVIQLLYRDEYYNEDSELKNILEVDTAKNRNGTAGKDGLYFYGDTQTILDFRRG